MFKYFIFLLSVLVSMVCFAKPITETLYQQEIAAETQQLSVDRERNQASEIKLNDLQEIYKQQFATVTVDNITKQMLERARLNFAVARADAFAVKQSLHEAEEKIDGTQNRIREINERLQEARLAAAGDLKNSRVVSIQTELGFEQSLYDLHNQRINELQKALNIARSVAKIERAAFEHANQVYEEHSEKMREKKLEKLVADSQQERQQWLNELETYNQQLRSYTAQQRFSDPQAIFLIVKIFYTEELIYISKLRLMLAQFHERVDVLTVQQKKSLPIPEMDKLLANTQRLKTQIDSLSGQLNAKQTLLKHQVQISKQIHQQGLINKTQLSSQLSLLTPLLSIYTHSNEQLKQLSERTLQLQILIQKNLNEATARRQSLPGFNVQEWLTLSKHLSEMFKITWNMIKIALEQLGHALSLIHWSWYLLLVSFEILWLVFARLCRHYLDRGINGVEKKRNRVSANVAFVILQLLRRNLGSFTVFGAILMVFIFTGISYKVYQVLVYVALICFAFRFLNDIARLLLVETINEDISGQDVRLYHRLRWVFGSGGLITALTVISHELQVSYDVRDVFNRLFMLFLLVLSIALFKVRKIVPRFLNMPANNGRAYLQRAISLVFLLFPLTLFSNAVVGIIGYVQLAWVMSYYQMILLLVLTAYVIFRGILIDLIDFISQLFIQYLQNGWLWSEVFLKPIDRIIRILVLITTLFVLCYGWGIDSYVITTLSQVLQKSIYTMTGSQVTVLSAIEFILALSLVIWITRWSREFSYRWLFLGVADQDLRNSLSVFLQYSIAIFGAFFTLHVLGIGISGLSFILTGLAVGLGFGLRDFTNNIVSGIMLLVERPVREGDLVTVGTFEGQVTHIGLRAMMIKSWDYMEVMIPNSEAFNKIFTNWTHQDSTVRTVVIVKIHRSDNPFYVQSLIMDVLKNIKTVLRDPEPQVLLKEISEVLIQFDVRYYLNIQENIRAVVRSEVLLGIWKAFQEHHIRHPYPQQDILLLDNQN